MRSSSQWKQTVIVAGCCLAANLIATAGVFAQTAVTTERVPGGGIQPQVMTSPDGTVHLVYFTGEAAGGDAFYVRRGPQTAEWSEPIRVNTHPGSVIATGTIRGAQLALGSNGHVHVAWNGSAKAQPRGPSEEAPLLYTRLTADADQFEPQRNLIEDAYGLDGGACIAADSGESVYVAWHGGAHGGGEEDRRVYLRVSHDDGATFDAERPIDVDRAGACGCCGMTGAVSHEGKPLFLYRSAEESVHRDMYLLTAAAPTGPFTSRRIDLWEIESCPMSSAAFACTPAESFAAWQTQDQVYFARLDEQPPQPTPATGSGPRRKHPAIAVNDRGEVLLVWTEGTGWNKGGSLAWQLYGRAGQPTSIRGRLPGIPVWSFARPYVRSDGLFVILY